VGNSWRFPADVFSEPAGLRRDPLPHEVVVVEWEGCPAEAFVPHHLSGSEGIFVRPSDPLRKIWG
jgi:hypothetical protein